MITINGEIVPSEPRPPRERSARLMQGKVPWVSPSEENLTPPSWFHKLVICNDDCDNCIMNTPSGCAKECFRFPDLVCEGCPCRASKFADVTDNAPAIS